MLTTYLKSLLFSSLCDGVELQLIFNNDKKQYRGNIHIIERHFALLCKPSRPTCLPQADADGAMIGYFVMTGEAVHVAKRPMSRCVRIPSLVLSLSLASRHIRFVQELASFRVVL